MLGVFAEMGLNPVLTGKPLRTWRRPRRQSQPFVVEIVDEKGRCVVCSIEWNRKVHVMKSDHVRIVPRGTSADPAFDRVARSSLPADPVVDQTTSDAE